jgi:putative spermidine/putrescine transport system permease protein
MSPAGRSTASAPASQTERARGWVWGWFCALPLLLLTATTVLGPFVWRSGAALWACTQTAGCAALLEPYYLQALLQTLWVAGLSTVLALPLALLACAAVARHRGWSSGVRWLAGLGANFAGVPLALSFTLMFGAQGVITQLLGGQAPLQLAGASGLLVAYVCFQLPLAALLLLAPVQMLEPALEEAAATLGAGRGHYWRRVALPLLAPSLVEVAVLLFANAAAAYATPFALAGSSANVLAVRLTALVSGDLFADPRLPALLALMLFAVLVAVLLMGRLAGRRLALRAGLA